LESRAEVTLASFYGGDFYSSALTSQIVRLRHGELLRRTAMSQSQLQEFSEIVIADCPSIRDTINSEQTDFLDFLKLLDKAQKFRTWVAGLGPDEKLVTEYLNEISAKGWLEKMPTRILRYVIGSVAGTVLSPIAALGLSAADSFMVDKIAGGWRPSHFIDNKLKPFLNEPKE
jgi:hypothetical protein